MADGPSSQTINRISEELSSDECRKLLYLCGDLRPHWSTEDVRGILKNKMTCQELDQMFLLELILRIRRFDILKNVLRTNKQEAETMLGKGYVVPEYRVLMTDVSQDMGKDDLNSFIFLLNGMVPRGQLEKAKCFLDVVVELEMLDKVSCDKVDLIYECLRNVRRLDLARKVQQYQMRAAGGTPQSNCPSKRPMEKQHCQLNIPCDPVSWRRTPVSSSATCHWVAKPHAPEEIQIVAPACRKNFSQAPLEAYRMQANPRGVCLIIDCVGTDGDMLVRTFSQLHFRVVLHKWLNVQDMLSVLRKVSRASEHRQANAFACCLLSRATDTHLLATEPQGPGLSIDSIRQLFTAEACPLLAGKPKLFFIQNYSLPPAPQGWNRFSDEDLETDHRVETVPEDADIVWSRSSIDAQHLENSEHRSVYMQSLSTALLKGQRRGMHFVDIHTELNRVIYDHNQKHQGAMYHISLRHTLRKNLFF